MSDDRPEDRRRGWFDKRVSMKDVIFLLGLVFAMGQTWAQFGRLRDDVTDIQVGEFTMATKEEMTVVDQRLRRWIDRYQAHEEYDDQEFRELLDMIHQLELKVEGR